MPAGRPKSYNVELGGELCSRLAEGRSLKSVCRDDDMPSIPTVFLWRREHPEFFSQYEMAIRERAELQVEEMLEIADDGTNDWMAKNDPENQGYMINGESLQRSKLRVETRKWAASKLIPKYADKVAVGGASDMPPVQTKVTHALDVSGLTVEQLEALQQALMISLGKVNVSPDTSSGD